MEMIKFEWKSSRQGGVYYSTETLYLVADEIEALDSCDDGTWIKTKRGNSYKVYIKIDKVIEMLGVVVKSSES